MREALNDTLVADYATFLKTRTLEVNCSARVLYQELRKQHQYCGTLRSLAANGLVIAEQAVMRPQLKGGSQPAPPRAVRPPYGIRHRSVLRADHCAHPRRRAATEKGNGEGHASAVA